MPSNPVEGNFVTRLLLGLATIMAMFVGGSAVGELLQDTPLPYGGWIGVALGAVLVFVGFTALYRRYDSSFESA